MFTGKSFDTLQEEAKEGVNLASLFTVDEAAIANAFSFDQGKLGAAFDLSGFDFSGMNFGALDIDVSDVVKNVDISALMAQAPAPDFSGILGNIQE